MSDDQNPDSEEQDGESSPNEASAPFTQDIVHSPVSARVPEHIAHGVFSTGVVVLQGSHEFILDFLLRMTRPHQLAARVVLPFSVVPRLIAAMRENLKNYNKIFGPLSTQQPPQPTGQKTQPTDQQSPEPEEEKEQKPEDAGATKSQVTPEEIYDQLKLSDEILAGTYANAVMIGHTQTEFAFDFITTFFPRSTVSCRVFLSAPNVPRFLDSLTQSFNQYQKKIAEQQKKNRPHSTDEPE